MIDRKTVSEHRFFLMIALYLVIINYAGFGFTARQRIIKEGFLYHQVYIHAFFLGSWILLYFIQTALVFIKRKALHMTLGKLGVLIITGVLLSGFYVAFKVPSAYSPLAESSMAQPGRDFSAILAGVTIAFFGFKWRLNKHLHKRLMLVSATIFSSAAVGRFLAALSFPYEMPAWGFILLVLFPLLALIAFDLINSRTFYKVHWIGILATGLIFVTAIPALWENDVMDPILRTLAAWVA